MRSALVAAIAIWLGTTAFAAAEDFRWSGPLPQTKAGSETGIVIKEADVGRLRAALNLSPEQQPHWAPVEAALLALARQDGRTETGLVQRTSGMAAKALHLRRLKAAAKPLIHALDDNQKRDAIAFARRMGYSRLVAAF